MRFGICFANEEVNRLSLILATLSIPHLHIESPMERVVSQSGHQPLDCRERRHHGRFFLAKRQHVILQRLSQIQRNVPEHFDRGPGDIHQDLV